MTVLPVHHFASRATPACLPCLTCKADPRSLNLQCELELFRMHNSSLTPLYEGHMIKATVLEVRSHRAV